MIGYAVLGGLLATLVAFGTGFVYGGKGPRKELAVARAEWKVQDNARRAEGAARQKEYDDAIAGLRKDVEGAQAGAAASRAALADADRRAAVAAAENREALRACRLSASARRVFDDAAGPRGVAAPEVPRAGNDAPGATREAAGGGSPAGGVAPPAVAATPVDCVTVYEVGVRNTARAAHNAGALMACQRYSIALWEGCTGNTFPWGERAPWLTEGGVK